MFETIWSDARYAVRSLRRTPGFTIAAVLTLALGIGGTTAIVSAVDAVLLRPLPYDDPDRVVTVWEDMRAAGNNAQMTPAPANYFDWASRNRVFEATAATAGATANITNSAPIVVINQTFAQRYWRNDNALGHRIALTSPGAEWMTIVGVVADVLETGYERGNRPGMYVLASQVRRAADNLVIRVDGDPLAVASATRRVIAGVDAEQPVGAVRTMDEIIDLEVVDRRGQSILLTAFAASALLLAAIGLYGPLSHLVAQQRREIGIRMALGATANGVTHAIVGRGLALTGAGLAAGVLAAGAGTGIMRNLLFGVQPNDPATFVVVTALLLTVSLIAIWIPARRATRVDPMIALRAE